MMEKQTEKHAKMKHVLSLIATLTICLSQANAESKPNVVLVHIDDLGCGDLGAYGCADIPTPNIDRFAAEGVRCTASYITNPPYCPSRCSLMMGQYGQRFGKYGMSRGLPIPGDRPTLARFLRDHGYVTGQIGKWACMWYPTSRKHKQEGFMLYNMEQDPNQYTNLASDPDTPRSKGSSTSG